MPKRHFLMLAHTYKPTKHDIGGWYASEKLDGMRCFWDGGVSRGKPKREVPWANNDKDDRYVDEQIATGLWSRYGNVIHAPDKWLDHLPKMPLDGELYIPRYRQELMKIVKKLDPDASDWDEVKFHCFDIPVITDGGINLTNFATTIRGTKDFIRDYRYDYYPGQERVQLITNIKLLNRYLKGNEVAVAHEQYRLPFRRREAIEKMEQLLGDIVDTGGEGLIVRRPGSIWVPWRTHDCLKIKPLNDDEGIVTGYTTGRKTDKGSKLLGMMGALILDYNGQRLELSGFTDAERELGLDPFQRDYYPSEAHASEWAAKHPGEECPDWITNPSFPRGTKVTFKFRGKTKDGIPQEARYWRIQPGQ